MFRIVALAVLFGLHAYLAGRLIGPLDVERTHKLALYGAVALIALVHPTAAYLRFFRRERGPLVDVTLVFAYALMGVTAFLLSLVVVRDVAWWLALLVDNVGVALGHAAVLPEDPEARRALLATSSAVVVLGAFGASLLGLVEARRVPRVRRVAVPIAGLAPELEGFTIAHLSDLHVGPTIGRDFVAAVVDRTNELAPDLIALTGDFVDGDVDELHDHVAPLAALGARHGVFYVTGNHEYYAGAEPWVSCFAALGHRVLLNEHVVISRGDAELVVAGICDYSAGAFVPHHRSDPKRALSGAPARAPRIMLAHQPRSARLVREAGGVDLLLAGHTHGGQMWPWNLFVPLQQPITAGLRELFGMWIYVSRGVGYWGPPFRLGAPSEIALLTLRGA